MRDREKVRGDPCLKRSQEGPKKVAQISFMHGIILKTALRLLKQTIYTENISQFSFITQSASH